VEAGQPAPGPDERLLRDVLGVLRGAEHPVAVREELGPAIGHELAEGALVPGPGLGQAVLDPAHHVLRPARSPGLIGPGADGTVG
jgi:hypothetical protein